MLEDRIRSPELYPAELRAHNKISGWLIEALYKGNSINVSPGVLLKIGILLVISKEGNKKILRI